MCGINVVGGGGGERRRIQLELQKGRAVVNDGRQDQAVMH